jgi:hypothetical protein
MLLPRHQNADRNCDVAKRIEECRLLGLCRVALAITDVSEERSAFIIKMTTIGGLGTTLAVTSNRRTLRRNTMISQ